MRVGKLDEKELIQILRYTGAQDPSVRLGPQFGEDAGVVGLDGRDLIMSCDPVTLAAEEVGWYAVHLNANDIAVTGGTPRWFLSTILLPESASFDRAEGIARQISEACRQLGVAVVGGHTEVTAGLSRALVCGTMIGVANQNAALPTSGVKKGDVVVMTGTAGIEGTALLALDRPAEARYLLGDRGWENACRLLRDPGISVVEEVRIARAAVPVHALHDPTEGGICAGVYELARASGLGIEMVEDHVLVRPETEELCGRFGLDPLRMLASGALLAAVAEGDAEKLVRAYREAGKHSAVIARTVPEGYTLFRKGLRYPLMHGAQDQIAGLFQGDLL